MAYPTLHKDDTVFGPWTILCKNGPTFRVHNFSFDFKNGQWTFHKGPGHIRVQ